MDERLERILGLLRERNGRITLPRRVIISALLRSGGHLTAEQLTATVRADHPDVHPSTVYRCLEALQELKVVHHAHLGHGPAVYHLTDDAHQHLVCRDCGTVVEMPNDALAPVADRVRREFGFSLDPGHFALGGLCGACSAGAPPTPRGLS